MIGDIITKADIPGVKDINLSELVRRVEKLEHALHELCLRFGEPTEKED
jgi:hypothetical protein